MGLEAGIAVGFNGYKAGMMLCQLPLGIRKELTLSELIFGGSFMFLHTIKEVIKSNDTMRNAALKVYYEKRKHDIQNDYIGFLKKDFRKSLGYDLHLDHPVTFNEKLQWLKVHYRDPIMTQCADKYEVRKLIEEKIGRSYLVPIYGAYDNAEEINPDTLPEQFVLKPNHSSGRVLLCRNKKEVDWTRTRKMLNGWLGENYYYQNGEWVYKDIKPKIICEHLLQGEMIDYKFLCFYSEPKMLFTCSERETGLKVTFFDMDFHRLPFIRKYPSSDTMKKPVFFDDMVRCARILSRRFPFVRVDFYENEGHLYFGELTFFPGNGMEWFKPVEWDKKIGDLLDLSKVDKRYVVK